MSDFKNKSMTNKGVELLSKALSGGKLEFTRIEMGSGTFSGDISNVEGLVELKQNLKLTNIVRKGGQVTLSTILKIEDITSEYDWTEIGVYAKGSDEVEVLYMYGYTTNTSFISKDSLNEKLINVTVMVSNVAEVTAIIDSSIVYLKREALEEHNVSESSHNDIREQVKQIQSQGKVLNDKIGVLSDDRGYLNSKDVSNTDLNNLRTSGKFHGFNMANSPIISPNMLWTIDVTARSTTYVKQVATNIEPDTSPILTYERTLRGGTWQPWKEIATTDKTDISPLNGWVVYGGYYNTKLTVSKSGNIVSIDAFIKDGIKTTGTTLFNIPQQYRPEFIKYHSCNVYPIQNGQQAVVEIGPSGDVSLSYIPPGATSLGIYVQYSV